MMNVDTITGHKNLTLLRPEQIFYVNHKVLTSIRDDRNATQFIAH